MQEDLDANYPSSKFKIAAINEVNADGASDVAGATVINDLAFLQDTDTNGDNNSDVWVQLWDPADGAYNLGEAWRDVHVVDPDGERTGVYPLTQFDLRAQDNYDTLKGMLVDAATSTRVAQSPWQNRVEPLDTNNDGFVVPNDALRVINRINGVGAGELPAQQSGASYYDVTGDNQATARDVLSIIRHLNSISSASGEPAGEPVEAAAAPQQNSAVDAYFAYTAGSNDDTGDDEDE